MCCKCYEYGNSYINIEATIIFIDVLDIYACASEIRRPSICFNLVGSFKKSVEDFYTVPNVCRRWIKENQITMDKIERSCIIKY